MDDCEKPLNSKTTLPQICKAAIEAKQNEEKKVLINLKLERKKHVMSLMDTLLTLLIVTPLIVGYWRGTWDLMDMYPKVFPPWESFLFGGALHLSFAITRDGLQDVIKFKTKTFPKVVLAYSMRRLYTYLFAAACIMNWRGGWIIFDDFLGIQFLPDGRVQPGKYVPIVIGVLVGCLVLLGMLRSCRNILAAPFVIGLDTKSTAFDFPTRYRKTISYTTLYAVNNSTLIENTNSSKNMSSPSAEKLSASHVTVEKQVVEHISPRPFVNDLRGASPSGFSPSFGPSTPPSYAQIPNHKTPAHPKNIQDIIQYLSENAHRQKELIREEQRFENTHKERDKFKIFPSPRVPYRQTQENHNPEFDFTKPHFPQDPFFAYKPQDPSDINLLAPSSFRFAPAILSSGFYRNRQKLLEEVASASKNASSTGHGKPISLTLNIYPTHFGNEVGNGNRFRLQNSEITSQYRYPPLRLRNGGTPRRMVVHLNVYPGTGSGANNEAPGEENQRKFQKNK